eukprot:6457478-Amphidinium_carterae.1
MRSKPVQMHQTSLAEYPEQKLSSYHVVLYAAHVKPPAKPPSTPWIPGDAVQLNPRPTKKRCFGLVPESTLLRSLEREWRGGRSWSLVI